MTIPRRLIARVLRFLADLIDPGSPSWTRTPPTPPPSGPPPAGPS